MNRLQKDLKLIVCILPKGGGQKLLQLMIDEFQNHDGNLHHARGVGRFSMMQERGIGEQQEKDIVEIVVPKLEADSVFEQLFIEGGMNQPHGGFIYMTDAPMVAASDMIAPQTSS